ncbi:hypothetical protein H206_01624 [Candidatus Electrothrix aarhusensis]|jgi:hypothetical protein|uniref:Uncharacterized protein n=1 Tax=Candidatus Electrothrix aarhusensis TaxID=1859131 RepID=A0A3S4T7I9_9BACT|nr:hypothetical protein H206_01624 [Candidatus Electrothrix aarhusensis]
MNKRALTTGILIILALAPTLVGAVDDSVAKAVQTNLDYIWNLVIGALIFFIKSRKII